MGADRWGPVTLTNDARIDADHWYAIRVRCEGARITVWLDGTLVIDYTDDGKGPTHGRVGVGTWSTQSEFKNLKVTSLDGKALYEGLPALPETDAQVLEEGNAPAYQYDQHKGPPFHILQMTMPCVGHKYV